MGSAVARALLKLNRGRACNKLPVGFVYIDTLEGNDAERVKNGRGKI
jgi:hypothetical protein